MKEITQKPDYSILHSAIQSDVENGEIRLLDQRMLLLHGFSLAVLRREIIDKMGSDKAREMFSRLGYQQGVEDCRHLKETGIDCIDDLLSIAPLLREKEGFVYNLAIERMQYDDKTGEFWGDYLWENSWEAEAHLDQCGVSGSPACWMMTGYACGFTTAVMGRPVLWREVECRAMGHEHCRVVAMPLEEGDDLYQHLSFMKIEEFISTPKSGRIDLDQLGSDGVKGSPVDLPDLVGTSPAFNRAATLLKKVAATDSTVLFTGESGVGKERFSQALHSISQRADKPFISINCAAIPSELVEAELFGVEKGAFTGATASRPGKFERADGGTLFLDEVSSLPFHAQGKLLRVLQEREIERVGGVDVRSIDIRLVAAANVNLKEEVKQGRFREDLFYRLNVFPIEIPPLRKRRDDIPLLLNLFIHKFSAANGKTINGITKTAVDALMRYSWPGNIRELVNICERAVILADDGGSLDLEHLFTSEEILEAQQEMADRQDETSDAVPGDTYSAVESILNHAVSFEDVENMMLEQALQRSEGNVSAAARLLNLKRGQFEYRMKKYR
ncbi:regulatory protein, Fis family [Amphritea atlantica]|uniref:Regulatory protein, Fis family n=1 Tax=Amphritea atlantica TaxID=355243 RepID=A0A1H9ECI1_9GAMM|nr:sigma 54-interacting transcriptional regulator [Amphritea atlantica]SEQ23252.1 regulatory protein, Fis family [Amphritea atlantica]